MKKVNGKQKGNRFEREMARYLSESFQDVTNIPSAFLRNSNSGSSWGGTNESKISTHNTDFAVYGDLVCPKTFKFCVECKNYKDAPSFNSIVTQKVSDWDEWISQVEQDAKNSCKFPLLIVKYNRVSTFCLVEKNWCDANVLSHILEHELHFVNYKNYIGVDLNKFFNIPHEYFFTG